MSLLQEIITASTTESISVTELLRKVHVLAARGKANDLAEWVKLEQSGYPMENILPSYRGPIQTNALAKWSGPNGMFLTLPLGREGFPERFEKLFSLEFREPTAKLERMTDEPDSENRGFHWTPQQVAAANELATNEKIPSLQYHQIYRIWIPVANSDILAVTNAIRDKVVELALELEQTDPDLGSVPGVDADRREEISAKFNQVIVGDTVIVGETVSSNFGVSITAGDPESLRRYLDATEVSVNERDALVAAAQTAREERTQDVERDGRLKSAISKAAATAGKIGSSVATSVITTAVQQWIAGG